MIRNRRKRESETGNIRKSRKYVRDIDKSEIEVEIKLRIVLEVVVEEQEGKTMRAAPNLRQDLICSPGGSVGTWCPNGSMDVATCRRHCRTTRSSEKGQFSH